MKIFNPNQLTTKPFYIRNKIILSPGEDYNIKLLNPKLGFDLITSRTIK